MGPTVSAGRPMILFVGAFPPADREVFGGMVTSCRALLDSSLPRRADLELLDSTQISHPPPSLPVRALLAFRRVCAFVLRFERRKPDVVLLFAAVGASVLEKGSMAWYARLRGVPALLFPRGGAVIDHCERSALTRFWVRRAFRGARVVLCQGERWRQFAHATLGFALADLPVVPNWTATPQLLQIGARRQTRVTKQVHLLFVGWLDREKGVAELLEAVRALAPALDFDLTLAGEGNFTAEAAQSIRAAGLEARVILRGWLGASELAEAYARADVFVLPSWAEGLPNAMIEAMAAGLACVLSSVGNIPHVVDDGQSALLVPPRDVAALSAALKRVIEDAPLRARLGAAAHALAARSFGVERAVEQILGAVDAVRRSR